MDNEKLIQLVRGYKLLYDLSDKKYSDNQKKDQAWNEIGIKLNRNGKDCKKAWALLRDAYRRTLKKKKYIKREHGAIEKKWKFQDEMSFLLPYIKKRPAACQIPTIHNYDTDENTNEEAAVAEEISLTPDVGQAMAGTFEENPITVLMRYIMDTKKNPPPDDIEQFMAGITATVRSFPTRDRAIAKAKIFEIVSNMEIEILNRPSVYK